MYDQIFVCVETYSYHPLHVMIRYLKERLGLNILQYSIGYFIAGVLLN